MIYLSKKRTAFTMIELVFAIVVIGILASLAMPRIDRDLMNEAGTNILADIRYTQHLALMDNKHEFDEPKWQRKWWKIGFEHCSDNNASWFETVSTDLNMKGNINTGEEALDPANNLPMDIAGSCTEPGVNKRMLLTKNYGILNITQSNNCGNNMYIGFDYLGRPHSGYLNSDQPNYASYLSQDCNITFTMSTDTDGDGASDTFTIRITAETGYAFIENQPDS